MVSKCVTVELNQNQFDALTDFVFNVGPKAFSGSTLLRLINESRFSEAAMEFPKWHLPPLPGIIRRRAAEQALFLRDDNLEPTT